MRKYSALLLPFLFVCSDQAQTFVNGQAARAVIGQVEFTSPSSSAGQNVVGGVSGLAYVNGMLWAADSNRVAATPQDNRVLMFPTAQIPGPRADVTQAVSYDNLCSLCGYSASLVLGQVDFSSSNPGRSQQGTANSSGNVGSMSNPTAVASDGTILAVADTDNNRVLIWNSMPSSINQPADLVLGQPDFTTFQQPQTVTASSLRGPQGVWISHHRLFVADTQNYRILIWNSIPTRNNQPADLALGQPNFSSGTQAACNPTKSSVTAAANELCNPVSVTADPSGTHLFVADLGFNRVLIWNSLPTAMNQNADLVIGQPDLTSAAPNFSNVLCASNGTDSNGNPTYPSLCEATLDFPRYALSDGTKLFVADGGNDRVLIFNSIPTTNGAKADIVLGQPNFTTDVISNQTQSIASTTIDNTGAVDIIPSPMSLAYDGLNLFVSDPTNNRILVFTPADTPLPPYSVVNWASEIVRQEGTIVLSGTVVANDTVTITIQGTNYKYTVKSGDTLDAVAKGLVAVINANSGDPNATAIFGGTNSATVYLSSKGINLAYDSISLSASSSNTADITTTASGAYLSAGTAATGAAGMLVEINGTNLSDQTSPVQANPTGGAALPTTLGGAQVYTDGFAAPLLSVSSTQIVTLIPYTFTDRNSTSVYVRTVHNNGTVTVTTPAPVYIAPANPGIFNAPAYAGQPRPWPAIYATHQTGNPTAVVSIDGTAHAGDTATITVANTNYTYTVASGDTLATIVSNLVNKINSAPDPNVTASAGGAFTRVVLTAIQPGAAGSGIAIAGSASSSAQVTVTAYTSATCCNVPSGIPITVSNPAVPGELINITAAGLGILTDPSNTAQNFQITGQPYNGPQPNNAVNSVSATMGGSTAQVIYAGLQQGSYGMYQVQLIVPSSLSTNNATQTYIAQNAFISNTVLIPVGPANPVPTAPPSPITVDIDSPSPGTVFSEFAILSGWAIDQNAAITSVAVSVDGVGYGAASYGGTRQDVCDIYTNVPGCPNVGWNFGLDTSSLANGSHTLQVTAAGADGLHYTVASPFTVANTPPSGSTLISIDRPGPQSGAVQGMIGLYGWAVNPSAAVSSVAVTVDGVTVGNATYGTSRPDVCAVYSGWAGCPNVGWSYQLDTSTLTNGVHTLGIIATSNGQRVTSANTFTVANWSTANPTLLSMDIPNSSSAAFSGSVAFAGWAINSYASISSVAYSIDGVPFGNAAYGGVRQDVCNAFAGTPGCPNVGWYIGLDTTQLSDGSHTLAITVTPTGGGAPSTFTAPFQVANTSATTATKVSIDSPHAQNGAVSGTANAFGWALNTANNSITSVEILVDGVSYGTAMYGNISRPDVCAVYSLNLTGCPVGWSFALNTALLTNGNHTLEARAKSTTGQTATTSSLFTVANSASNGPIRISVDQPNGQSNPFVGLASFRGWAIDDNAAITNVSITVDGIAMGTANYGLSRPDVCVVYPSRAGCPNVGWSFQLDTTTLSDGGHSLGVTARGADGSILVAAANFTVANWSLPDPMIINIDSPNSQTTPFGTIAVAGWAIDANGPINGIQVSVDGVPVGTAAYGGLRSDVCNVFPGYASCPNVGWNYSLDSTLFANGTHILGITATTSGGQSSTAATTFTVSN